MLYPARGRALQSCRIRSSMLIPLLVQLDRRLDLRQVRGYRVIDQLPIQMQARCHWMFTRGEANILVAICYHPRARAVHAQDSEKSHQRRFALKRGACSSCSHGSARNLPTWRVADVVLSGAANQRSPARFCLRIVMSRSEATKPPPCAVCDDQLTRRRSSGEGSSPIWPAIPLRQRRAADQPPAISACYAAMPVALVRDRARWANMSRSGSPPPQNGAAGVDWDRARRPRFQAVTDGPRDRMTPPPMSFGMAVLRWWSAVATGLLGFLLPSWSA